MATPDGVLEALRRVMDPDLRRDIVSLGFVKELSVQGGDVAFAIELTTPACPVRERLRSEAEQAVRALPGVSSVAVRMTAQVRPSPADPRGQLLPGVKNIVPIASGKGGVGKSTVSVNLACALAQTGARVGLLDADIYGPSVPMILGVREGPRKEGERLIPPVEQGIKVISMAFFVQEEQAVVWRGPMLAKMLGMMLGAVEWGELDYLLADMPPGTGDVQLTMCQSIPLTGAAIVSTPQDVALRVAQKAAAMFTTLRCPVLGILENMSHYLCPHCGNRDDIFGSGGARAAAERLNIPFLGEIPLATEIRTASDDGRPIVIARPDSPAARAFREAAGNLAARISVQNLQGEAAPKIAF